METEHKTKLDGDRLSVTVVLLGTTRHKSSQVKLEWFNCLLPLQ